MLRKVLIRTFICAFINSIIIGISVLLAIVKVIPAMTALYIILITDSIFGVFSPFVLLKGIKLSNSQNSAE